MGEELIEMLTDEQGNEYAFQLVKAFRMYGKRYAAFSPANSLNAPVGWGEDDILILRVDNVDGEDVLVEIEDENEFDRVSSGFDFLMPSDEHVN